MHQFIPDQFSFEQNQSVIEIGARIAAVSASFQLSSHGKLLVLCNLLCLLRSQGNPSVLLVHYSRIVTVIVTFDEEIARLTDCSG